MANEETMKFYEAYQKLEQIAQDMQDAPEKVIDVMEEKLKEAIKLNKYCNGRLAKVQDMLDKYKAEANVSISDNSEDVSVPTEEVKKTSESESFEDDIPF